MLKNKKNMGANLKKGVVFQRFEGKRTKKSSLPLIIEFMYLMILSRSYGFSKVPIRV
jgi:hypothetical protein